MMDIITLVMACSLYPDYSISNAMIEVGSKNQYLMVTPAGGSSTIYPTMKEAVAYSNQQIQGGNAIDIGVTQLPSRWLKPYHVSAHEVLRPCKNVVIATQILSDSWNKCTHIVSDPSSVTAVQACALSLFKTGDPEAGLDYARQVMNYASAHPFSEVAAPAMEHWEKNATVPKLPINTKPKNNKKNINNPAVSSNAKDKKINLDSNKDSVTDIDN